MPDPVSFNQLMADVAKAQEALEKTYQSAPPSAEKDLLGQVLQSMTKAKADAERTFPEAIAALRKDLDETEQKLQQMKRQHAEAQSKVESAKAKAEQSAAQPGAKPSQPKADPSLGATLKEELLGLFPQASRGARGEPKRTEIWQEWEESAPRSDSEK